MKRSAPLQRSAWPQTRNRDPGTKPFVWAKRGRGMRRSKSTTTPTKEEARWMAAVADYGCIVCRNLYGVFVPCEVHHLLSGGIRMGHLFSIGLCPSHHRLNDDPTKISRHPWRANFERRYGTELELLEQTRMALGWKTEEAA